MAGSIANAKSRPGSKPASRTARIRYSKGSAFVFRSGAKPPSSPTPVERPALRSTSFRVWYTWLDHLSAVLKSGAPTAMIMNSWKSTLLSAWTPPLSTFIIGTGRVWPFAPPRYSYSGRFALAAAARATASDAPRMALAPRRPLLGVPSAAIIARSTARWSVASMPTSSPRISPFTFSTAFRTPLPR